MTDTITNPTATRPHVDLKKKGFGLATKEEGSRSGDREESVWLSIDDIDVDYTKNGPRFPAYEYKGQPCSFCENDILDLLETLPKRQEQPIDVSVNPATRRHEMEEGYRRYYAMCILRDRGIRPERGWVLLCQKVPRKKSAQDYADAVERGGAMQSLKPLSPIDLAHYAELLVLPLSNNGCGLKEDDARKKLAALMQHNPAFRVNGATEISEQHFNKLRRLTSLDRETKLAVHEGQLAWTSALSKASKKGEGNVRGPAGPQTPRGFKPREAVAYATSKDFADEIPETVPRADVLALLGYAGNAETTPPAWLAKAKAAYAASLASDKASEAATTTSKKKAPLRVAELKAKSEAAAAE